MDWREEFHTMLMAFERQTRLSLVNIRTAFKHDGLSFNPKFKKYFLEMSNARLEQAYDQLEISCRLEDELFGHSSTRTVRNTGAAINSTQVKSESENATLIEIDDSSDDEAAVEIEHTSNETVPDVMEPSILSIHSLGTKAQKKGIRLEQNEESGASPTGTNDANEFRIGLTTIRGCQSKAKTATNDKERTVDLDDFQNVFNNSAGSSNGVTTNRIQTKHLMVGERQNDTLKNKSGQSDVVSKIENRKNITNRRMDKGAEMNKKTTVGRSPRPALKQSDRKKRFRCTICEYSANYKCNFDKHMRTHTGERPYRCDRCGKGFIQPVQLKRHAISHTDVYPFHCKGCFSQFSLKTEKVAHDKECTTRRYECHLCKKYVTYNKMNLKIHMRKHTGENPFHCQICMKRFTRRENLKKHLNTVHARISP